MFQIDLFHVGVWWSAHSNHMERCSMQMKWMAQIRLLHCKNKIESNVLMITFTHYDLVLPSSTNTTSTIAFNGMSTVCVHIQFSPQSGGRLSPLQNCSGGMSCNCEIIGAGGDTYEISSISEIKWSPPGATRNRLYILDWNNSSTR